jgi:hypothetical protein
MGRPPFVKGLNAFSTSHDGPFGAIIPTWKREGALNFLRVFPPRLFGPAWLCNWLSQNYNL